MSEAYWYLDCHLAKTKGKCYGEPWMVGLYDRWWVICKNHRSLTSDEMEHRAYMTIVKNRENPRQP